MGIGSTFKRIRDQLVIDQVQRIALPVFPDTPVCRQRIKFSGRVQHVGFRLEVYELANSLGLTGWCENLENGDVLVEFQGTREKIDFLASFLESLVRIKIRNKIVEEISVIPDETEFIRRA